MLRGVQRDERRGLRRFVMLSALAHLGIGAAAGLVSTPFARPAPAAIQVELLASLPVASRPEAVTKKPVVRKPVPPRPAKVAPPKPKQVVLPKRPRARPQKAKPVAPAEIPYEDALAQLRAELGESEAPTQVASQHDAAPRATEAGGGVPLDAEIRAWMLATKRHVRSVWVTPPEFLDRNLRTEMWIDVAADGQVVGEPEVVAASGDPFWDDNAVRAIRSASPLPKPPEPGRWRLAFSPRASW